jgi:hypothetical protein
MKYRSISNLRNLRCTVEPLKFISLEMNFHGKTKKRDCLFVFFVFIFFLFLSVFVIYALWKYGPIHLSEQK